MSETLDTVEESTRREEGCQRERKNQSVRKMNRTNAIASGQQPRESPGDPEWRGSLQIEAGRTQDDTDIKSWIA